ncbi:LysR family transcriptional regulator, partial [Bordetella pertussis]|nr:LysR family transcriptional regulator [Bordetella pertussis]
MSDLKLFEDLIALAQTGSFVRAAELRHVTHPAFGRRIRALETWAGAPLVERGRTPVVLTAQGEALLQAAGQVVEQVDRVREQLRSAGRQEERILRIGTGRSLARTLVADWIARLRQRPARLLDGAQVELSTGVMQEMAALLEQGRVDLVCCYEHPALSVQLTPGRFRYMTLGIDKLVPVCQADARGRPRHALSEGGPAAPLITYSGGLAMARIAGDRLETFPYA